MKSSFGKDWIVHYGQEPEQAWGSFLQTHHKLIMAVIRKFVEDHDSAMEMYTHTLERLRLDDCKKLTAFFSKPRSYTFQTWVAVVVRNCCLDWFRMERGRTRLPKCIEALSAENQLIFKYVYEQGYSYEMTYELLRTQHGKAFSSQAMGERLAEIDEALRMGLGLKSRQVWQGIARELPLDTVNTTQAGAENPHSVATRALNPEEEIIEHETTRVLREILAMLPADQQLLIQLRYSKKLSLQEIARIMKMKSLWRVHRKLQKALKVMKRELLQRDIGPSDLDIL